ncbi:hypothetical protein B0H11DRAFT_2228073 [Mycena galericulata]|nr:hypothetical protein B0H11DRAFT_2228073 [Mycena galericulata]
MSTGTSDDRDLLLSRATTSSFRDNLRPDSKYITTWPVQDWNNQVVAFMNLIYLALITERVPIIPPFTPFNHTRRTPVLDFGEVFDVTRLQNVMGKPLLEWHQVKDPHSATVDVLGCWHTRPAALNMKSQRTQPYQSQAGSVPQFRDSASSHVTLQTISYTTAPNWTLLRSDDAKEQEHSTFWSLASLTFPDRDASEIQDPEPSFIRGVSLEPDQHLLCFDDLTLVSARNPWEYSQEMSPAWRFVGKHMHWNPRIQHIADLYTRKALGVGPQDRIPPYIAVYARFGNVTTWCDLPPEECFPPLFAFARGVQELKAEIRRTKGIDVDRVIVISDKRERIWWDAVHKRGWYSLDHSKTAKRYGAWYPVLIDAVVQSGSLGFVTADDSIASVLASRRVSSWQGGVVNRNNVDGLGLDRLESD